MVYAFLNAVKYSIVSLGTFSLFPKGKFVLNCQLFWDKRSKTCCCCRPGTNFSPKKGKLASFCPHPSSPFSSYTTCMPPALYNYQDWKLIKDHTVHLCLLFNELKFFAWVEADSTEQTFMETKVNQTECWFSDSSWVVMQFMLYFPERCQIWVWGEGHTMSIISILC